MAVAGCGCGAALGFLLGGLMGPSAWRFGAALSASHERANSSCMKVTQSCRLKI